MLGSAGQGEAVGVRGEPARHAPPPAARGAACPPCCGAHASSQSLSGERSPEATLSPLLPTEASGAGEARKTWMPDRYGT
ncbi:hypothetical protein APUTEX25_002369 [Auxenochlorella protothecoides]|uniref:Uncharacterized protein n=1 Tax=Auxenochlorella protothecoides TaxID=3075 RepID=A0A3M7L3H2_AUXPR|nr:hypothetical protein APUTEX25_002369 [Auxenochlorella protothecoides]|eukprot:RMZ57137.1 hypothetical protein APUTEX25_002369 [Auxenochlorella protothecoides]